MAGERRTGVKGKDDEVEDPRGEIDKVKGQGRYGQCVVL